MVVSFVVFLAAFFSFLFVFIIYPFLFVAIAFIFGEKRKPIQPDYYPAVSVIICAKDEETHIENKINNLKELDYPEEKCEIIVVSDGSLDNTNKILRNYGNEIKFICLETNVGKTEAQNIAVKQSTGEILFFSDANSIIEKNAVKNIVRHFIDKKTAGVSGCLSYYERDTGKNMESQYNSLDLLIKKSESKLNCVFGSFGTLYAIRKTCYIPLPPYIISDFVEPVLQLINGYKNILEPEVFSYEEVNKSLKNEMKRKSRIVLRSMIGFFFLVKNGLLKNPLIFIHCLFRKFLRWLLPVYLIAAVISLGIFLFFSGLVYFSVYSALILLFFLLMIVSYFKGVGKNKVLNLFFYLFIINVSTIIAFYKLIKGEKIISWKPRQ